MNKKQLINKIIQLIDAINSLRNEVSELKRDNDEMKIKLGQLESKMQNSAPAFVEDIAENQESIEIFEDILEEKTEPTEETANISVNAVPLGDDMMEYGSVAIGRVVQESIKYANLISASNGENKKEVLNLIMGKAEVVKAEIFTITDGELSDEVKKELIDTQLNEAIDYFKSAYGQLAE